MGYLIAASRYCHAQQEQTLCRGLRVKVLDSAERGFITPAMVKNWFAAEQKEFLREPVGKVNTLEVEAFVRRRGFVKTVRAYTSMDGMLNIELTQRKPVLRVNSVNGYDFYVTDDNYILPTQRYYSVYVPVVTGMIVPPFGPDFVGSLDDWSKKGEKKVSENYLFLAKLINFVKFVGYDDFWNAFIVQIRVNGTDPQTEDEPQVEIVPRAGDQVIALGGIDAYEQKLDKLMSFYRKAVLYEGWDRYRYVNLKYKDQIVCVK